MATGDVKTILDKLFSKGLIKNLGDNKTPDFFANSITNLRIKNGGITPRQGYETLFDGDDPVLVQNIVGNSINDRLYVVQNGHLRSINLTNDPIDDTDIGSISHTGKVRFISYGKYTIILTGAGYPWVYDGSSLVQLTSANLPVNTNPSFGMKFAGFTVINSNLNKNVLSISRPITLANQNYSYDWSGSGSETISFDGEILGLTSTLSFLWIFTENTIEYISKDNLTTTGGIASLYSIPIASGDKLLSPDTVTNANEFIFYMTNSRRIKSINYVQGNPVPQVAVISEEINEFLQNTLDTDQTNAFSVFDRQLNLVKFFLRSNTSTVNDLCVIRDLNEKTWLIDKDKYFNCMAEYNENYYAGSAFSYRVIQDEIGTDDDNQPVDWEFLSAPIILDNPTNRKQWRGNSLAGKINKFGIINREFIVDNSVVMNRQIYGTATTSNDYELLDSEGIYIVDVDNDVIGVIGDNYVSVAGVAGSPLNLGIEGSPIAGSPVEGWIDEDLDELFDFERVANTGAIRVTGKKAQIRLYGGSKGQKLIIDYSDITYRLRVREFISDIV